MREAHVHICLPAADLGARAHHLERFVVDFATETSRAQPDAAARSALDEAWAAHRAGRPLIQMHLMGPVVSSDRARMALERSRAGAGLEALAEIVILDDEDAHEHEHLCAWDALLERGSEVFRRSPWVWTGAPWLDAIPLHSREPMIVGWRHRRGFVLATCGLADALCFDGYAEGVELSLQIATRRSSPPPAAVRALYDLARAAITSGRLSTLLPGDVLEAQSGRLTHFVLERDPALDRLQTDLGPVRVLMAFGLVADEFALLGSGDARQLLQVVGRKQRMMNKSDRPSLLAHPTLGPQLATWAAQTGGAERCLAYALLRVDALPDIYGEGAGELLLGVDDARDLGVRLSAPRLHDAESAELVACGAHSRLCVRRGPRSQARLVSERALDLALATHDVAPAVSALMAGPGRRPLAAGWWVRVLPGQRPGPG